MVNIKKFRVVGGIIALLIVDFLMFSTITSLVRQPSTTAVYEGLGLLLLVAFANYYLIGFYFKLLS